MDAAKLIAEARHHAGLSLRELARRAGTSHATLSAYESGRVVPRVDTLQRILAAAGFSVDVDLVPRRRQASFGSRSKGEELADVLGLANAFPVRRKPELPYPVFGRR